MWKAKAFKHAKEQQPSECCGLLAKNKGKKEYWPCKNIANQYEAESFVIDPNDWALCEDSVDEIIGIVHSHPDFDMNFSEADIASCNHLELRFYLVNPISKSIIYIDPEKKDAD
jgi:proteasome lid subunit RPN8/RPN11|tara:strand:- start:5245 stop:5586 length:342 start_codon:yes stop_codon:yes gene_type:complete